MRAQRPVERGMMSERTASGLQIVAVGFGTSVAMWFAGYVTHLPAISLPAAIVLGVMVACILAGGVIAGRHAAGGALAAAAAGAVTAVLNLLILGSVVAGEKTNELLPAAWVWIPGSILLTVLLAAAGGAIGRRRPGRRLTGEDWRYRFALVAAAATLLLLVAGGVVTSTESGLAVPDWPSSFGSNMFLYPLARMTGGIYYEHAHRLAGTLVGLTTIALAVVVWVTERRAPLRVLGAAAVLMVVIQGLIGAAGVLNPSAAQPSIPLATVHGVFAQIFFVTIVVIAAAVSRAWREARPRPTEGAGADRSIGVALVHVVLLQLIFGALYRHLQTPEHPMPWPAHAHLTLAAIVAVLAYLGGLRAWAKHPDQPVLKAIGIALMGLISLQLVLGIAALIAVLSRRGSATPPPVEVLLTTTHQANGALVFATSALLALWNRRLLADPEGER